MLNMQKKNQFYTSRQSESIRELNKSNLLKNTVIASIALFLGFIIGFAFFLNYGSLFKLYVGYDNKINLVLNDTYNTIKNNYDGTINQEKLIEGANKGLVSALGDQYTQYLSKAEAEEFQKDLNGDIGFGIGVELGIRNDRITVLRTLADNPAVRAGILAGDYVVAVNDEETSGLRAHDVARKIRGDIGTSVKLLIERNGREIIFNLKREKINDLSVDYYIKDNVGILRILRFDDETGSLARKAVLYFKDRKVNGIVVDLRNNGGGYVSASKEVAGIWLDDKIIMTEKRNGKVIDTIRTTNGALASGIKTSVIINGSSASASEILAGALRDYGVATIIGEKSFGKGSVQKLVDLYDGAQLKVTIAKWFTPNNKNINGEGIEPDKSILYSPENINKGIDDQLNAAIDTINKL